MTGGGGSGGRSVPLTSAAPFDPLITGDRRLFRHRSAISMVTTIHHLRENQDLGLSLPHLVLLRVPPLDCCCNTTNEHREPLFKHSKNKKMKSRRKKKRRRKEEEKKNRRRKEAPGRHLAAAGSLT